MKEPTWILREVVVLLHEQSLARFGGSSGFRNKGLLDSALARPLNLFHYSKPSLFELAASYAFGLAKNHPFIDGNEREGFVVAVLFLELNGLSLQATEADAAVRTLALAVGEVSEAAYAKWLKANSKSAGIRKKTSDEVNVEVHEGRTITLIPRRPRPSREKVTRVIKAAVKDYTRSMKRLA